MTWRTKSQIRKDNRKHRRTRERRREHRAMMAETLARWIQEAAEHHAKTGEGIYSPLGDK